MNASYAKTDRKFLLVLILAIFSLTLEAQNIEKLAEIRNDFLMKRDSAKRIIKKLKSAQSPTAKDIEYDKIEYFEYNTPVIYKPHNKKSAGYIEANKVRDDGILGFDLNGSSQIINVWDVGAVYSEHVELEGRIEQKDEAAEFSYHATHLAGTMIAEGIRQEAQGISYKGFIEAYDWGNDLSEMADAASNGIYLSNHSYGTICGWDFNGEDDKWYWYGEERHYRKMFLRSGQPVHSQGIQIK